MLRPRQGNQFVLTTFTRPEFKSEIDPLKVAARIALQNGSTEREET